MRGLVLTEPKTSVDDGIPSSTSVNDLEGYYEWIHLLCVAQERFACKCLVCDDTSPSGDPFEGDPQILGHPSSLSRSTAALRALLTSHVCAPYFTVEQLVSRTPHSLKGILFTVDLHRHALCAHH